VIRGRVTSTPEAIIALQVRGPHAREVQVQAVLDTGFTDYLTLPRATISELQLTPMDTVECELADGRIIAMESFEVVALWDGAPREILALAADGDALVGMSLLYGSRVAINVLAGEELTITPIV
jgi:clan AA aspartic protease